MCSIQGLPWFPSTPAEARNLQLRPCPCGLRCAEKTEEKGTHNKRMGLTCLSLHPSFTHHENKWGNKNQEYTVLLLYVRGVLIAPRNKLTTAIYISPFDKNNHHVTIFHYGTANSTNTAVLYLYTHKAHRTAPRPTAPHRTRSSTNLRRCIARSP